jgi:hypothetical protein
MKKGFLAISLLLLSTTAFAVEDTFQGVYNCKGKDPYLNSDYSGTVTITPQNTVYRLDMKYDTGEEDLGTGGLYDQTLLSVVFQDQNNKAHIGLEQYHFSPDHKKIGGFWVYLGQDKLGTEVCEKVEPGVISKIKAESQKAN